MASNDSTGSRYPGPVLVTAGAYAWRLLVVGAVFYFLVQLLSKVALVVIPFIVSILIAAALRPLFDNFRRRGASRGLATALTMFTAIAIVGGLLAVVITRAIQSAPQLGDEINNVIPHVKHWLINGPLKVNPTTVNNLGNRISNDVSKNSSKIASTALSTGKALLEFLGGAILALLSAILLVYDGDRIWAFLLKGFPKEARPSVDVAGRAAWTTVSYYIRGVLIVALFHGTVVGITLTILGAPLALPLGVLVGLGAFVPLLGAIVTGALAVAVAGLSQGLGAALIMVAVLLIDNQIEAHVLQPFVVGRYVRIHPLAVVLALGVGGILFGIFGAVVAVPIVACANSSIRAVRALRASGEDSEEDSKEDEPPPDDQAKSPSEDQPGEGDTVPTGGG
jgi:predicted PurR-regulated permease PerM